MPCNLLENVRFGINFKQKCKLKIKDLLNTNVEFASPYLTFMENKKHVMHTLAILIKNINRNNNEMDHWKLVRKFFFVDNISGFETISNFMGNKVQKADKLSILRYMKSLTVIINIQNVGDKNKIFPPLLIIEYGELTHQQLHEMVEVTLDYTIKFTLTNNNIHFYLKIIIGILVGFAVTFSGLKAWNYSKKHHNSFSNTAVLFWFFIYAIGAVGNVIILTLVILCMYLLMFYKSATSPHILLFGETNDKTIKMFTIVAFIFKLIEILGFICQYWNFKIIFLDWEQPKMTCISSKCDSSDNSMHKLHTHEFRKNMYKSLQMSSKAIINNQKKKIYEANKQNDSENVPVFSEDNKYKVSPSHTERKNSLQEIDKDNSVNNLPVSIWRTYFIANQWLKLQTKRKVSVKVQLLAVSCIFQIIQMYPWILMSEVPNKFSEDNSNFTLYYTVCILTYTIIYCIQWVLFVTFYEQYVTNRMQKFVNLCSIANISVFIYPFNYYGFYIHGRSVHGFADADLPTIMNNLSKEKNNLCAHRGLIPGTTQQTFVLSLTETFKDVFITLSRHTEIKPNNVLKRYYFPTINWEQNFKTQLKLKKFLCKFIDHCFPDVDFIIKEQHFIEKLCNIKFHYNDKKSVFYIDNNYSFSHVLLYGHEWLLATFEMSIFILVIVLMKDCILAAATVTFISMLLVTIVKQNGKNNLNNNVLLNKIFII
ncbi:meckelin [Calliopsis andreniformis]|uniref:meckelin n=1 Tax=Calliopsis andreniformis TaxID=337506 RepID=UPI003FCE9299